MDAALHQNHSKNFPIATSAIKLAAARVSASSTEDILSCSLAGVPSALLFGTQSKHYAIALERCLFSGIWPAIFAQLIFNQLGIQQGAAPGGKNQRLFIGQIRTLKRKSILFDRQCPATRRNFPERLRSCWHFPAISDA
jgi:hypothetical protein